MDFGRALARLISEKSITAAELSRRSGLTPGAISSYKSGRIIPTIDALQKLAGALGCRVYEIVAKAEGVELRPLEEAPDDARWRELGRAMEPQARYHVEAIAAAIAAKK